MAEVAFHREPPSNIPTMVTAFSGWIDAGEAATDAMRFLPRVTGSSTDCVLHMFVARSQACSALTDGRP